MLSYANIATHKDNQPTALILTIGAKDYGWKSIFEVKKEKKKTEHTNIYHFHHKTQTSKYSRHVFLCNYSISKQKKIHKKRS